MSPGVSCIYYRYDIGIEEAVKKSLKGFLIIIYLYNCKFLLIFFVSHIIYSILDEYRMKRNPLNSR